MLLEGLQIPLTTPFYPDGRLNLVKLEQNVDRYCRTPAAGLVVLSESGEPTSLSDTESRQVLQSAIQAAAPQKVMVAGASRDSVRGTLERIELAAELKYDAVLVSRPAIVSAHPGQERIKELLTYFRSVADRSALPIILSAGLPERGDALTAAIVIELAFHPRIVGMVDRGMGHEWIAKVVAGTLPVKRQATVTSVFAAVTTRMQASERGTIPQGASRGDTALAVLPNPTASKTRTKAIGFQILVGTTNGMLEGVMAGAVGAMPAFAAAAPQACYEVLAAWKDGDEDLANEKQSRLCEVAAALEERLGVAAVKFGCDLNGYFGGLPRLPLLPLTGHQRAEVEKLMQGLRN